MPTVFVDTSVIISALLSNTGASSEILRLAGQKNIRLLISDYVVDEVRLVLKRKASRLLPIFDQILQSGTFHVVSAPTKREVSGARAFISDPKDAPILSSAIHHHVDYLITLDKKDFILDPSVSRKSGVKICVPATVLNRIRTR